ncbi:MAG: hypothetical protein KAW14_02505 [Candidatus Aegiribacteria sp.]|nr:hypothetical protein [Candidatus Aegiribacteria sp.]
MQIFLRLLLSVRYPDGVHGHAMPGLNQNLSPVLYCSDAHSYVCCVLYLHDY